MFASRACALLLLFFIAVVQGGCSGRKQTFGKAVLSDGEIERIRVEWIDSDTFQEEYRTVGSEGERREIRGTAVSQRMRFVDAHYALLEDELRRTRSTLDFTSDITIISLNAVGALIGPASTKAILHAISGGLVGARASAEKNFFFDQSTQVIIPKMQALRAAKRAQIEMQLDLNTTTYPLAKALGDVDQYFRAGSVTMALIALTNDAGAAVKQSEAEVDEIIQSRYDRVYAASETQIDLRSALTNRVLLMSDAQAWSLVSMLELASTLGGDPKRNLLGGVNDLLQGKEGAALEAELERIGRAFDVAGVPSE